MQRVSMIRFQDHDWADFGKLLRSRDRAWSLLRRKVFDSPRPPPKEGARRAQRSSLLCSCGSVPKERSVVAIAVLES